MRNRFSIVVVVLGCAFVAALAGVIGYLCTPGLALVLVLLPAPFGLFALYEGLETHAPAFLEREAAKTPRAPSAPQDRPHLARRPRHATA